MSVLSWSTDRTGSRRNDLALHLGKSLQLCLGGIETLLKDSISMLLPSQKILQNRRYVRQRVYGDGFGSSVNLIRNLGGDTAVIASAADVALHDISVITTDYLQTNKNLTLEIVVY